MRPRWTNRSLKIKGEKIVVTTRLAPAIVEAMDAHVGEPDLDNRAAIVQDACALWCYVEENRVRPA